MRYTGITCSQCQKTFLETDDVVVCPQCGTPAHKICRSESGECVNASRHDEGFVWQAENPTHYGINEVAPAYYNPYLENNSDVLGDKFTYSKTNISQNNHILEESTAENNPLDSSPCHNCGGENELGEPSCVYCGARLYLNASPAFSSNAYGAYNRGGKNAFENADIYIDEIPAAETAAYVQQNSHVYIKKFVEMDNAGTEKSWNWVAFFFPNYWLFYRKMYRYGIIGLTILTLTTIIANAPRERLEYSRDSAEITMRYMAGELTNDEYWRELNSLEEPSSTSTIISSSIYLILRIYLGLYGNMLYRKKINEDIMKIRDESPDSLTYLRTLDIRGGGSIPMILVCAALGLMIEYGLSFALMSLLL